MKTLLLLLSLPLFAHMPCKQWVVIDTTINGQIRQTSFCPEWDESAPCPIIRDTIWITDTLIMRERVNTGAPVNFPDEMYIRINDAYGIESEIKKVRWAAEDIEDSLDDLGMILWGISLVMGAIGAAALNYLFSKPNKP